ncbi:hypothetical protein C0J52_19568 [Blattella germanica]|nr:hypothetical protein C0J52_19568 [Blattella germanica]
MMSWGSVPSVLVAPSSNPCLCKHGRQIYSGLQPCMKNDVLGVHSILPCRSIVKPMFVQTWQAGLWLSAAMHEE